jgi:hypothetical protein
MSLSIQGTLDETTVADLFRSLMRSAETGIVSLEAFGRHDNVYFTDGKIVFASTSDPDLGLAEALLGSGEINLQQYTRVTEELFSSRRMGSLLCELGYLKPDQLNDALERQVAHIVKHALAFRGGNYTIDFTTDFPKEIVVLTINCDLLVMNGISNIEQWSLISRGISRMGRLLRQSQGADARIFQLELGDTESHVYSLFSEPQSVESACERSYLSNFLTCRAVWALLTANLLEDVEGDGPADHRAEVEKELELEDIVERYNTAFQKTFAIVFQQIGDHTYDFVDRVVLHLSPNILPYLSGVNLLNEGRVDFEQVLNNMIASGSSDTNQLVHDVLNELLYGWIFEIKREFGTRLDGEMAAVLAPLRGL